MPGAKSASVAEKVTTLPANATVKALVVGIENYQSKATGGLPKVDYARRDAEGFLDALRSIYGDRLVHELLLDDAASSGNLRYALKGFIQSLEEDDLFIFYYAGHGFHGQGGNRITAWDSHAHSIEETTILLREILLDRLQESDCRRALAFVDACAAEFAPLAKSRAVITGFSDQELNEYLSATEYFGLYLSCSPAEKSYPSDHLKHGIWTNFLLKALRGEAVEALGPDRYLTDQGLKDYLRVSVRRYITDKMTIKGSQTPQAVISSSGTFAICEIATAVATMKESGDLSDIHVLPILEFFEGVETGKIQSLRGFTKPHHFVPKTVSDAADAFIGQLLTEQIREELQDYYQAAKKNFGLRSKDIQHEHDSGAGSIETEFFRFMVECAQSRSDPAKYRIVRMLELRQAADETRLQQIDDTFVGVFDKIVVKTKKDFVDFSTLVNRLEDLSEAHGGTVEDETAKERVTYTAEDGTSIVVSVATGRISVSGRRARSVRHLLTVAHEYRFGLQGPSLLLGP